MIEMSREAMRLLITSWFDLPAGTPRTDTWFCSEEVRGQPCAGAFRRANDFDVQGMRMVVPLDVDWGRACPDCRERYRLLGVKEPVQSDALGVDL